jgi:L-fuconolactonase
MLKIDSHQHYWIYDPVKDAWIDGTMPMLQRDFLPEEVYPQMQQAGIDGCVAVQADQSETETMYLLHHADKYDFIKGVVGWIDFKRKDIKDRLWHFSRFKKLKGFRHIVQAEKNDRFILDDDFCRGIGCLEEFNFTYDILIYPKHINYAHSFVEKFPNQRFIIDHLAKPYIKEKVFKPWEDDLSRFKKNTNVYCKLAGLATLADWNNWKAADFSYYVNKVLEIFTPDRVIFGTDWPVCLTGSTYQQTIDITYAVTDHLTESEKAKVWGGNCIKFYNLEV